MQKTDELAALRAEIEQKREFAARLEQERTDLELEITVFEAEYNVQVRPLQDELDVVKLHVKEYELRNELLRFRGNRLSAMQLEAEVEMRLRAGRPPAGADAAPPPYTRGKWESVSPQPDVAIKTQLKSLYRELAKRFHPDLAADEAERETRSARMAEINEAYARADLEALRRTATQSNTRPKLPPTLSELLAERDRLDALVIRLRQEIAELNRDPLMLLKIDAALARHDGRDLLAQIATDLHIQLVEWRGVLDRLIAEFRSLVEQVGLT